MLPKSSSLTCPASSADALWLLCGALSSFFTPVQQGKYQQLCAYEDRGAADFKCGTLRSHKLVLLPLMQCSTGSNESMGSLNMCI